MSVNQFCSEFDVKLVDLVEKGLFGLETFDHIQFRSLSPKKLKMVFNILKSAPNYFLNFNYYFKYFPQLSSNLISRLFSDSQIELKSTYPISDYILKSSIIAAFNPLVILEIGTYYGWGSAAIAMANPKSEVLTVNPISNSHANNPIEPELIAHVFRDKNIEVRQIFESSKNLDLSNYPNIDVVYIDGDHSYDALFQDLQKFSQVSSVIAVDDYIPNKSEKSNSVVVYGSWNVSVTSAANDWLRLNPNVFSRIISIISTPILVLIK